MIPRSLVCVSVLKRPPSALSGPTSETSAGPLKVERAATRDESKRSITQKEAWASFGSGGGGQVAGCSATSSAIITTTTTTTITIQPRMPSASADIMWALDRWIARARSSRCQRCSPPTNLPAGFGGPNTHVVRVCSCCTIWLSSAGSRSRDSIRPSFRPCRRFSGQLPPGMIVSGLVQLVWAAQVNSTHGSQFIHSRDPPRAPLSGACVSALPVNHFLSPRVSSQMLGELDKRTVYATDFQTIRSLIRPDARCRENSGVGLIWFCLFSFPWHAPLAESLGRRWQPIDARCPCN